MLQGDTAKTKVPGKSCQLNRSMQHPLIRGYDNTSLVQRLEFDNGGTMVAAHPKCNRRR